MLNMQLLTKQHRVVVAQLPNEGQTGICLGGIAEPHTAALEGASGWHGCMYVVCMWYVSGMPCAIILACMLLICMFHHDIQEPVEASQGSW
jgi:hypothetical protein